MSENGAILTTSDVVAGYVAEVDILNGVTIDVGKGEIVTVVGPNGAGKSTLIKTIFGLLKPRKGSIRLRGEEISGDKPHTITRRGMNYVPQLDNVFPSLTVEENLEVGSLDSSRTRGADRLHVRAVPPARRAPAPDGGHHERRRTPDGRDGAGADDRPAGAPARRALGGTRAGVRGGDLREDRGREPRRCDDRDGRAERAPRPGDVEPRLRARRRQERVPGQGQASSSPTTRSPSSISADRRGCARPSRANGGRRTETAGAHGPGRSRTSSTCWWSGLWLLDRQLVEHVDLAVLVAVDVVHARRRVAVAR